MKRTLTAAAAALMLLAGPALARQDTAVDEVVVTGSRVVRTDYGAPSAASSIPVVRIVRRADNMVVAVRIVCDTRDDALRHKELKETVLNMVRAAEQSSTIELGLSGSVIGKFDPTMLDSLIDEDADRDQVSEVVLVIKTPITAADTFDQATARLKAFAKGVRAVGRTEVLPTNQWELTIKGPDRYRPDILKAISADAASTAGAFGEGYAVTVTGLEHRVTWRQAAPLDLALYIPYSLTVTPKP